MILIFDTSGENVFLGLWDQKWLNQIKWQPGRNLSADIILKIEELYKKSDKSLSDSNGIIVKTGPGSFTGLRIGLSVANALAYSLNIPIVGVSQVIQAEELLKSGRELLKSKNFFKKSILPEYGREPNITNPKKL